MVDLKNISMPDAPQDKLHAEIASLRARIALLEQSEQALRASEQKLVQEVAERKRAEQALLDSEERLRLAQQVAHIGTFDWDMQTGVNRWTTELEAMYGLAPGGFVGTQAAWEQLVYPEDLPETLRRAEQALETGDFEGEWRVVWPDGSVHWLASRARYFKDKSGRPLRLLGVNIDITERKQAEQTLHKTHEQLEKRVEERTAALTRSEQELREQSRVLQSILDSMTDGVAVADRQGKFLLFNPAGEQMLGLGATETPVAEWSEKYGLMSLDGLGVYPSEELPLARAMRGEVVRGLELLVRNERAPADVIISVNASPLMDDAGQIMGGVAVFRDVTEPRHAQTALAESEERLRTEQQVLRKMLELEDRERKLVANEIHDGFVQYVVGAHMRLEGLRDRIASGATVSDAALEAALTLLQRGIVEARRLISGLRPMIIDELGLVEAVEHLLSDSHFCQGVSVSFDHQMQSERLDPMLEATLLRIVQEGITNIKRHSGCDRAAVRMTQKQDRLLLTIEDWGQGFEIAKVPAERFGLRSIQERARLFGGLAEITSAMGKGTKISVSVPIKSAVREEAEHQVQGNV